MQKIINKSVIKNNVILNLNKAIKHHRRKKESLNKKRKSYLKNLLRKERIF